MNHSGSRLELIDFIDLGLLLLAKLFRRKLHAAESQDFYDNFFTELDTEVRASGRDPRFIFRQEQINRALATYVPRNGTVLDVGCGIGDTLVGIGDGWRRSGVEFARKSAKVAQRRLGNHAEIVIGAGHRIPIATGVVRGAICLEVLEHLVDDSAALREIHRVLAPNGILIASVPYRHWFKLYLPLMGHYRHYRRADFVELLRHSGFEVVEYLPNCPKWSRRINYAYIACRIVALMSGALGPKVSPLDARLPGATRPLLETLEEWFGRRKRQEQMLDYSALDSSTFVVARRV